MRSYTNISKKFIYFTARVYGKALLLPLKSFRVYIYTAYYGVRFVWVESFAWNMQIFGPKANVASVANTEMKFFDELKKRNILEFNATSVWYCCFCTSAVNKKRNDQLIVRKIIDFERKQKSNEIELSSDFWEIYGKLIRKSSIKTFFCWFLQARFRLIFRPRLISIDFLSFF